MAGALDLDWIGSGFHVVFSSGFLGDSSSVFDFVAPEHGSGSLAVGISFFLSDRRWIWLKISFLFEVDNSKTFLAQGSRHLQSSRNQASDRFQLALTGRIIRRGFNKTLVLDMHRVATPNLIPSAHPIALSLCGIQQRSDKTGV